MTKSRVLITAAAVLTGGLLALPRQAAQAQSKRVQPERRLLGVSLGAPFLTVIRAFGQPSEIQTVALSNSTEELPGLGGGSGMASAGGPGGMMGGMMGMMGGGGRGSMGPYGGGGPGGMMGMMGGGGARGSMGPYGGGGGIPTLPPAGGGGIAGKGVGGAMGPYGGGGGAPPYGGMGSGGGSPYGGMMGSMGGAGGMSPYGGGPGGPGGPGGMMGMMGGTMGGGGQSAQTNMPEYSTAILWIYKREKDARLEFLINEDGRVAQISVAAPAKEAAAVTRNVRGARTSRGVSLGTTFNRVLEAYGYPERFRMLPGLRFYETYFTKNYHTAFTFDTAEKMQCVRITIALAD